MNTNFLTKKIFTSIIVGGVLLAPQVLIAQTVSGNGYIVEQVLSPIQGALSGNGYVVQQASQVAGGLTTGNG